MRINGASNRQSPWYAHGAESNEVGAKLDPVGSLLFPNYFIKKILPVIYWNCLVKYKSATLIRLRRGSKSATNKCGLHHPFHGRATWLLLA